MYGLYFELVPLLLLVGLSPAARIRPRTDLSIPASFSDKSSAFSRNFSSQHFNPTFEYLSLWPRQAECPASYPVLCSIIADTARCCPDETICCTGSGCCQDGSFCCGPDQTDGCCPTDSVCYPNDKCCPDGSVTCDKGFCAVAGSTCCGDGVCEPGAECMQSENGTETCCQSGQSACDDGDCCPEGSVCAAELGYCQTIEPSISSSASVSKSSSPSSSTTPVSTPKLTSTHLPSSSSSSSSSSCTFTPRQTSFTCSGSAQATQGADSKQLKKRQDSGDDFLQYCSLCGQQIPIMPIAYIPGETEELVSSTCGGIGGGDQIILQWAGDGTKGAESRRSQNGCNGYCASLGQTWNPTYNGLNQCDEFPPASSLQGGTQPGGGFPHRQCIFWKQNQLGGHIFQSYAAQFKLQPGQPFIIRILPGCGGISKRSLEPRLPDKLLIPRASTSSSAAGSLQTANSSADFLQDPRPGAANGSGFFLAPLSGAPAGNYELLLDLNGSVSEVTITDADGISYAVDASPVDSRSYSFSLGATNDLSVGAYVLQNTTGINMAYNCNVTLAATSNSSSNNTSSGNGLVANGNLTIFFWMIFAVSSVFLSL